MPTFLIKIKGIVQGVGYRPFVYKEAKKRGLNGEVINSSSGVEIFFNAETKEAKRILNHFSDYKPTKAQILEIDMVQTPTKDYEDFTISASVNSEEIGFISPDFAPCQTCINELFDPLNRRYNYPFISCTQCGPRYSIINKLPYDREQTNMTSFKQCQECLEEYKNPLDRRYHSQTNSCPNCGINIQVKDNTQKPVNFDLQRLSVELEKGKILAVKGTGGFLLICDATKSKVIQKLRDRKRRPSKPLAVLFRDSKMLKAHVKFSKKELKELESPSSPIVLLEVESSSTVAKNEIAPDLDKIGAMLPSSPLLYLLVSHFNKPLIATSGNISGSPILFKNIEAENLLSNLYDFILVHDLEIEIPQDDSVIQFSPTTQNRIILRRGRGLAPVFWKNNYSESNETVIGAGAELKSTICLARQNMVYQSQFLGNLSNYESLEKYKQLTEHFKKLFQVNSATIVSDLHPLMHHKNEIEELIENNDVVEIQHHKAHFYASLFEHDLIESEEQVLGVIWDGLGYGEDQMIWGGEFFNYQDKEVKRINHLSYYPYLLGDKMANEPILSAIALCYYAGIKDFSFFIKDAIQQKNAKFYIKLLEKDDSVKTSSMGRVFDAVAALLGLSTKNNFEGQAAILLEQKAASFLKKNDLLIFKTPYSFEIIQNEINLKLLIQQIVEDINLEKDTSFIAAKFHFSLIKLIEVIASDFKKIVFSGGVFQNGVLIDLAIQILGEKYSLYFHKQVSPNDENISIGQMAYYLTKKNVTLCV